MPTFDMAPVTEFLGADAARHVAGLVVDQLGQHVRTLDAAIAARDYRAIRQTAHAIGSAAANITAKAVWRQGGVIQERVDSGQTADVAELASMMAADTRALIEEIGQWLAPARTGA